MITNNHEIEPENLLALDVGHKRIGLARGSTTARLAQPLAIIKVDGSEIEKLKQFIEIENIGRLIIGLPRGLDGQNTQQTQIVKDFSKVLGVFGLPLVFQDEAGSTKEARNQMKHPDELADAHAAAIILQDYLDNLP
jgi:putative Holliday junction resolvase